MARIYCLRSSLRDGTSGDPHTQLPIDALRGAESSMWFDQIRGCATSEFIPLSKGTHMLRYAVTHAVTEESSLGEESHLANAISAAFPEAEHRSDGTWIIDCDMTAEDLLTRVSDGISDKSVKITMIPID
jgi:hypothetical protein